MGDILLALNPFSSSREIYDSRYGTKEMEIYSFSQTNNLPPHIFATGSQAFLNMLHTKTSQVSKYFHFFKFQLIENLEDNK